MCFSYLLYCGCFFYNFIICIVCLKFLYHRFITVSDSTPGSDMARMGAPLKPLKRDLARVRFVIFAHFFEVRFTTFTSVSHKLPV